MYIKNYKYKDHVSTAIIFRVSRCNCTSNSLLL